MVFFATPVRFVPEPTKEVAVTEPETFIFPTTSSFSFGCVEPIPMEKELDRIIFESTSPPMERSLLIATEGELICNPLSLSINEVPAIPVKFS